MITFKAFLVEARDATPLTMDDLARAFANNYSDSLDLVGSKALFRGDSAFKTLDAFELQAAKSPRQAKHGGDLYNELLTTNPENEGWPRRLWSNICTTSVGKASEFGSTVYAVFPRNDCRIAIAPKSDIWLLTVNTPDDREPSFILMNLSSILEKTFGVKTAAQARKRLPWIDEALSYDNLGCDLSSVAMLSEKIPHNHEVWFEGPCIMIELLELRKIMTELENRGLK